MILQLHFDLLSMRGSFISPFLESPVLHCIVLHCCGIVGKDRKHTVAYAM